jgi:hypothetical protein
MSELLIIKIMDCITAIVIISVACITFYKLLTR